MGCAEACFDEVYHSVEGGEDALENFRIKAEAESAKSNHGVDHAIVICLGVDEGDGGREAKLADDVEGELLHDGRGGAATSFDGVLVRGNCM